MNEDITFKEFAALVNEKARDGSWSLRTIGFCLDFCNSIHNYPSWRREKVWKRIRKYVIEEIAKYEKISKAVDLLYANA